MEQEIQNLNAYLKFRQQLLTPNSSLLTSKEIHYGKNNQLIHHSHTSL